MLLVDLPLAYHRSSLHTGVGDEVQPEIYCHCTDSSSVGSAGFHILCTQGLSWLL